MRSGDELGLPVNGYIPPAVPNGDHYEAIFERAEKVSQWGRDKIFLWFVMMTPGEWVNNSFFMACTVPPKYRWTASSKYWRTWVLANGNRPSRWDRLSPAVFKDKVFRVRMRKVVKNAKQIALTPAQQYSVVDELLEVSTGK